ncbi:MAG: hypothetical protein ACI9N0_003013 [Ilumatobacter sp.]|jgi:hypothetical protein
MQVVRTFELLPAWASAANIGEVGVAQTRLMARVASNPVLHDALSGCVEAVSCLVMGPRWSRFVVPNHSAAPTL